ncbi:MAG: aspartate aminotransferase family protein, partial [bacterium]
CHLSRENCGLWCAREFEKLLKDQSTCCSHTNSIAAIIVELVQGVGGICAPDGWTDIIRNACDEHGVILIVDEIQAGLGRTGKMLSCDHWNLVPDMIALAKGLGGGVPLGMTVTTDEIAEKFNTGTTPTGAGSPLACAAGLAFLDVLEKENLCENAAKMGALLSDKLRERVPEKFIGEIRLTGLMGGIELVKNTKTKEPFDKKTMSKIQNLLLEKGVILSISGPLGNVLRLQPPLCINDEEVEFIAKAVGESVAEA